MQPLPFFFYSSFGLCLGHFLVYELLNLNLVDMVLSEFHVLLLTSFCIILKAFVSQQKWKFNGARGSKVGD